MRRVKKGWKKINRKKRRKEKKKETKDEKKAFARSCADTMNVIK